MNKDTEPVERAPVSREISPNSSHCFQKRLLRFLAIVLLIAIALEICVFNYAYWIIPNRQQATTYNPSALALSNLTPVDGSPATYTAESQRPTITINNIDQPVKTLFVDAKSNKTSRYELPISLKYVDSTRSDPLASPKTMRLVPTLESTQYTTCSYHGNVSSITLTFDVDKGEILTIPSVQVNAKIPFRFSFLRIGLLLLVCATVYILKKAPSLQLAYGNGNRTHQMAMFAITALFLVLLTFVFSLYGPSNCVLYSDSGDQISQELVDAFRNKQVSLLEEPSQDLLSLENPYIWSARDGISYKWDHVLYNGKYYSYYGIAPVLLLFLPFNLLTGHYFSSALACFLFSLLGTVCLLGTYQKMVQNWFSKTPCSLVLCGWIIVLMSCGILFEVYRPMFYEVAEAAGFLFLTGGVWALFSSNLFTKSPIRLSRIVLSTLLLSLAVMSRPTLALYAIASLFWLGFGLLDYRRQQHSGGSKAAILRYLAAALLPFIVLGSVQMVYNYLRFGSVLEFGIQYSLTINDFTHTEFHPSMAVISVWNLLFSPPTFRASFPFLFGNAENWGLNSSYFFETGHAIGLFWRALPLCALAYVPRLLCRFERKKRWKLLALAGISGLLMPLIIVISTWESGFSLRYNVDFAWQMLLLALAIVFFVYNAIENAQIKRVLLTVMITCTVLSFIANMALLLLNIPGVGNTVYQNHDATILYYKISRLFEFWL